jgi:hypothetical protein
MTAVGFRVKSGFAIAVVLDGSRKAPRAVARQIVELSDPEVAETRQPYHDGFYQTEENPKEIARRVAIVKRCARKAVAGLMEREALADRKWRGAIVVGSLIDPGTVANPHIRAHAHEGQLFRTVLEDALAAHAIDCDVIVDKQLAAHAAKTLGQSATAVARTVATFGKTLGGRWRAEEKAAATAAWLALPA